MKCFNNLYIINKNNNNKLKSLVFFCVYVHTNINIEKECVKGEDLC